MNCNASYAVAIRSNHGVLLPQGQRVRENRWRKFDRIFASGSQQVRYIREIIFGKKRPVQYWLITTDPDKLPENSGRCTRGSMLSIARPQGTNIF